MAALSFCFATGAPALLGCAVTRTRAGWVLSSAALLPGCARVLRVDGFGLVLSHTTTAAERMPPADRVRLAHGAQASIADRRSSIPRSNSRTSAARALGVQRVPAPTLFACPTKRVTTVRCRTGAGMASPSRSPSVKGRSVSCRPCSRIVGTFRPSNLSPTWNSAWHLVTGVGQGSSQGTTRDGIRHQPM